MRHLPRPPAARRRPAPIDPCRPRLAPRLAARLHRIVAAGLVTGALAASPGAASAQAAADDASVGSDEAAQDQAVRFYEAGREHYQAGRYREAAEMIERALQLDPESPTLMYNLARIYELLGDFERSAGYYEMQLAHLPDDDAERESVEAALARVRGAAAEQVDAPPGADPEAPTEARAATPAEPTGIASRGAFYGTLATGLSSLVGGVALGAAALRLDNRADDWVLGSEHTVGERNDAQQRARRLAIAADTLLVTGAVATVTALVLFFVRRGSDGTYAAPGLDGPESAAIPGPSSIQLTSVDLVPQRGGAELRLTGSVW